MTPLERKFALVWMACKGAKDLVLEHRFHPTRMWRFDFAHVATRVAIEIEGGIWTGGRHTRGSGFEQDCEKYNWAQAAGWRVFRLTGRMINVPNVEPIALVVREIAGWEPGKDGFKFQVREQLTKGKP